MSKKLYKYTILYLIVRVCVCVCGVNFLFLSGNFNIFYKIYKTLKRKTEVTELLIAAKNYFYFLLSYLKTVNVTCT